METMRLNKILLALPLFLLLVGCNVNRANKNIPSVPTSLQVTRVNLIPQNGFTSFQDRINDAAMVQHLYQAALELPAVPPGGVQHTCLNDQGLRYDLDFYPAALSIYLMVVNPAGCQTLIVGKADERQMNEAFLSLFMQTIKVRSL
ncbi:MAG: hypothetical protein ACYDER_23550 [Ktedonobacteraceae bacterium]